MALIESLILVFVAGFITDLATGIGAIPFFFVDEMSDRLLVALWGLAAGIMSSASVLGLIPEGLAAGTVLEVGAGMALGFALVIGARKLVGDVELEPKHFKEADLKRLIVILGVLTVHSFPEGIAIGVSFAEMGLQGGIPIFGLAVPMLAITMTIAISIHNIPEGVAISIPFKSMKISNWKMLGGTIFSSLPQPIGAVIAYFFVEQAQWILAPGFGFAAGAMLYLVATEFVEESREQAVECAWGRNFLIGGLAGFVFMVPFFLVGQAQFMELLDFISVVGTP
ncbi:ZIP family metal transporter [Candidatus Nanohalococcus occultus]|uniref:ZIP family metal transporter n=1 Tax=Candidatus Nanohalococcus occultus TaxID=2978047 RepID=UPI0039DFA887